MRKRLTVLLCAALLGSFILTGCDDNATYADGTYEGKSSVYEGDEDGNGDGYGVVTITIKDGKIVECEFKTYETNGTLKDSEYGKQNGEVANVDFYNKAQRAVLASDKYAEQLVENGSLKEVDAISGATISYGEFEEAVKDALSKAKQ